MYEKIIAPTVIGTVGCESHREKEVDSVRDEILEMYGKFDCEK